MDVAMGQAGGPSTGGAAGADLLGPPGGGGSGALAGGDGRGGAGATCGKASTGRKKTHEELSTDIIHHTTVILRRCAAWVAEGGGGVSGTSARDQLLCLMRKRGVALILACVRALPMPPEAAWSCALSGLLPARPESEFPCCATLFNYTRNGDLHRKRTPTSPSPQVPISTPTPVHH